MHHLHPGRIDAVQMFYFAIVQFHVQLLGRISPVLDHRGHIEGLVDPKGPSGTAQPAGTPESGAIFPVAAVLLAELAGLGAGVGHQFPERRLAGR
jgi:hypothetical protein